MENVISVIGGDLRVVKLVEMLAEDGIKVFTYGLEETESLEDNENVIQTQSLDEVLEKSKIIIGSIPLSIDGNTVCAPFSANKIMLQDIIDKIHEKVFIAGNITNEFYDEVKQNDNKIIDILKREELAVLNTISTAEGAIQIAMEETQRTVHGSDVLIMGFGRISKMLAKMLDGIGANVYCETRRNDSVAWIKAYGYKPIKLEKLKQNLNKFDIIINTIPVTILNEEELKMLKKDCLIIDLASDPGGINRKVAKQLGIKLVWALSLPGKVAPVSSAEFIKETIDNVIKETII